MLKISSLFAASLLLAGCITRTISHNANYSLPQAHPQPIPANLYNSPPSQPTPLQDPRVLQGPPAQYASAPPPITFSQNIVPPASSTKHKEEDISVVLNSWIGKNINDLITTWGAPSGEYRMPNRDAIYTWQNSRLMPTPILINQAGDTAIGVGGNSIKISCKISVFVNPHGNIFNYKWEGNGC